MNYTHFVLKKKTQEAFFQKINSLVSSFFMSNNAMVAVAICCILILLAVFIIIIVVVGQTMGESKWDKLQLGPGNFPDG